MLVSASFRVGLGYDFHRLAAGRPLRLGGVSIPFDRGLIGHSDADVVLHAITDAILGAAGLPDIGELFPDTDLDYKGADSAGLLANAIQRIADQGWTVGNLNVIVHAEAPKLSAQKRAMAESIARMVRVSADCVSVKAKTNEGLGPIGKGKAVACSAVVLLTRTGQA